MRADLPNFIGTFGQGQALKFFTSISIKETQINVGALTEKTAKLTSNPSRVAPKG
jgi:hypothetical protein